MCYVIFCFLIFFFFFFMFYSLFFFFFFFSSRRRHTRCSRDWSSDVCSSDLLSHRTNEPHTYRQSFADFYSDVGPARHMSVNPLFFLRDRREPRINSEPLSHRPYLWRGFVRCRGGLFGSTCIAKQYGWSISGSMGRGNRGRRGFVFFKIRYR